MIRTRGFMRLEFVATGWPTVHGLFEADHRCMTVVTGKRKIILGNKQRKGRLEIILGNKQRKGWLEICSE